MLQAEIDLAMEKVYKMAKLDLEINGAPYKVDVNGHQLRAWIRRFCRHPDSMEVDTVVELIQPETHLATVPAPQLPEVPLPTNNDSYPTAADVFGNDVPPSNNEQRRERLKKKY